ncbi:hypothetical protein BD413DRAFT_36144 [Trametes elegans]|nr:hypothetical protein BD413DRAFT_36144 [Trametes elegans]
MVGGYGHDLLRCCRRGTRTEGVAHAFDLTSRVKIIHADFVRTHVILRTRSRVGATSRSDPWAPREPDIGPVSEVSERCNIGRRACRVRFPGPVRADVRVATPEDEDGLPVMWSRAISLGQVSSERVPSSRGDWGRRRRGSCPRLQVECVAVVMEYLC